MGLAMALLLLAAPASDRVTLSIPGASVRNAVAAIAKATDTDLAVADSANLLTLVLDVKDAPLDGVLDRIAEVTHGRWSVSGDRRTLSCGKADLESALKEQREGTAEAIREQQRRLSLRSVPWDDVKPTLQSVAEDVVAQLRSFDFRKESYDKLHATVAQIPIERLAVQVAASFPATELAALGPAEKRVYTKLGEGRQYALPRAATEAFNEFKREQGDWINVAKASAAAYPVAHSFDPRAFADDEQSVPDSMFVVVQNIPYSNRIAIKPVVVTKRGTLLGFGDASFDLNEKPSADRVGAPGASFDLTDAERSFAVVRSLFELRRLPDGTDLNAQTLALAERFARADADDPVGIYCGPVLARACRASDMDLVALLPDAALDWEFANAPAARSLSATQVLSWAQSLWRCHVEGKDGWVTIKPVSQIASRDLYLRRKPLADLFGAYVARGWFDQESLYRYVREQESQWPLNDAIATLTALLPGLEFPSPASRLHWNWLDGLLLPAALSPQEIALAKAGTLRFGMISAKARGLIESQLYGSVSCLTPPTNQTLLENSDGRIPYRYPGNTLAILAPGGIPANAKVTVYESRSRGVALLSADRRRGVWLELNSAKESLESSNMNSFDAAQAMDVQSLSLEIDLGNGWALSNGSAFPLGPDTKAWRTFDKLDDELRRALFGG